MTTTTVEKFTDNMAIDRDAVLKSLNLNPRDPNTQALLLVCDRYGLDPLLKHMVLIQGSPYVTRDGYLAIAHRSGVFDGMEVLEQGSDQTHFTAKVAVYRKDMARPFTFIGRYPKSNRMAKDYGPEMAVKVAEVQALRRAFNVTGVGAADERWDEDAVAESKPAVVRELPKQETAETPKRRGPRKPPNVTDDGEIVDAEVVDEKPRFVDNPAGESKREPRANEAQVADITDVIAGLKEAGGDWADKGRARWKAAGLPSVPASNLSEDQAAVAYEVLAEVYREAVAHAQPTLDDDPGPAAA